MEVGQGTHLQLVDKLVVDVLEFDFICLSLPLNFKSYFFMSSKIIDGDTSKSSDSIVSVYDIVTGKQIKSNSKTSKVGRAHV